MRRTVVLPLLRRAATAVAAGRVALGVAALASPSVPARPWVGASADELGAQVFGRALGGRDLALGLGALGAAWQESPDSRSAGVWYAAGALSDAFDLAITVAAWRRLPQVGRWLVAASAGGAAVVGAAGAVATFLERAEEAAFLSEDLRTQPRHLIGCGHVRRIGHKPHSTIARTVIKATRGAVTVQVPHGVARCSWPEAREASPVCTATFRGCGGG